MDNYYPIDFDAEGSFQVVNYGTAPAPCIVTFIPRVDFMTVVIKGLSKEDITIDRVLQGQELVIDGENRTVTLNGNDYFSNYQAWEFPKLQPGVNNVSIPNGFMADVVIDYTERFT